MRHAEPGAGACAVEQLTLFDAKAAGQIVATDIEEVGIDPGNHFFPVLGSRLHLLEHRSSLVEKNLAVLGSSGIKDAAARGDGQDIGSHGF